MTDRNMPAFPSTERDPRSIVPMHWHGMSLRDWFAGQALAGMLATAATPALTGLHGAEDIAAGSAYRIADAMLAARQREATE